MPDSHKTPKEYIDEIRSFPPRIIPVETTIPAFVGYTEKDTLSGVSLKNKPTRIQSFKEYVNIFGEAKDTVFSINITTDNGEDELIGDIALPILEFRMYYAIAMYFVNGGGACYIVSIGTYESTGTAETDMVAGLNTLSIEDEPTMILFPDALRITNDTKFYGLYAKALKQCGELRDRVTLIDLRSTTGHDEFDKIEGTFRTTIGNENLSYGAAYYPYLKTVYNYKFDESKQMVKGGLVNGLVLNQKPADGDSVFYNNNKLYLEIKKNLSRLKIILPPSSAMAGVYVSVDASQGVWKAPANKSLNNVINPVVKITDTNQQDMNVHSTGKSVNAIRQFTGKGTLVWGARTLTGNDNEWRYISVRRFFNMLEESIKKGTKQFVFEPNDVNTWVHVKAMVENFLAQQWRAGALQGAKPEGAYFVKVGLGTTMAAQDILEGRMIIEIGLAMVRPAEFIILRFSHKMNEG